MTIAVSAVFARSRVLTVICVAMAGVLLSAAVLLARAIPALSIVCAIAAVGLGLFPLSTTKAFRIDVTDIGQILLTDTPQSAVADRTETAVVAAEVVQLLGG